MDNKLNLEGINNKKRGGYKLNKEVKNATKSLKKATKLGIKVACNSKLAKLENKDAIIVMSFGTTLKKTRNETIVPIIDDIKASYPMVKVVTAFTSHIVIDRIKKNEGYKYPTPEEALDDLKAKGYTRVAIAQLCLIPGIENDYLNEVFKAYKNSFKKLSLATPLMYWMGQENQNDDILEVLDALKAQLPKIKAGEAILAMSHGTPHPSNAYYSVMQAHINRMNVGNVLFYTVEGWPNLDLIMEQLKEKKIKKVTLMPLMVVAGEHATNDMVGKDDSHKVILEKEGFEVKVHLHGLGEFPAIRKLFVERTNDAWSALQND
jgi:sirohydrochlorin cobaltochelatase